MMHHEELTFACPEKFQLKSGFYLMSPSVYNLPKIEQVHCCVDKPVLFSIGSPWNKIYDESLCIKSVVNERIHALLTVPGPVLLYVVLECKTKPKEWRFLGMIIYIQNKVGWCQGLFLTVWKGLMEGDREHTGDGYLFQTVDWCCEKPSSRTGGTTSQLCFSHVAVSKFFRKDQYRNRQVWCPPPIPP